MVGIFLPTKPPGSYLIRSWTLVTSSEFSPIFQALVSIWFLHPACAGVRDPIPQTALESAPSRTEPSTPSWCQLLTVGICAIMRWRAKDLVERLKRFCGCRVRKRGFQENYLGNNPTTLVTTALWSLPPALVLICMIP